MATQPPQLNDYDLELLSSYIDGQLGADERREIERRLHDDAALRRAYDELRATVQALRDLEPLRPPRSFTLDPAAVAPPQPVARLGWGRLLQVAGVFAAILVAAVGTLSVLGSMGAGAPQMAAAPTAPAVAPMVAAAPTAAPAATMAPAMQAPENAPAPAAGAPVITSDQASDATARESAPEASPLATPAAAAASEPAPEAAPAQIIATPAISSPGTTDLARPTPVPEAPAPPAAGTDVLLILMIAVVVVLAGGGVWLWRRSRSAR